MWILLTSISSTFPIVSFKYLTARLWFVISFFFLGVLLFKELKNIKLFVWLFSFSLAGVIIFNSIKHAQYGFERQVGTWIVKPFFNDHTHYAAVISMIIPMLIGFSLNKKFPKILRIVALILILIMFCGVLLSYSRAGLVSLVAALSTYIVLRFKINYRIIFAAFIIFVGFFFLFRSEIIMELSKNKQDSSGIYTEHIKSISNISTDASNLERINRWMAAFRMFKEKPYLGWGPGTYQLNYAPFQYSKEKTVISTNAGDMGNAHSEYIGPLSESGVAGMLSFIFIAVFVIYTAVKAYKSTNNKEIKMIVLCALLGLITYFTHGFMNNFLDTDKASILFWSLISVILSVDLYHKDKLEEELE
ncbi:MAG: O-antigen ligase family protein [Bacteroidales bacterium]|nr:O-antigen ligase family protein [Bacteroidales bacterium]